MDSAAIARRLLRPIPNINPNPNHNSSSPFLSTRCRPWRRPISLSVRCLQTPNPNPTPPPNPGSLLACSAIAAREASAAQDLPRLRLRRLVDEFRSLPEPIDRVKRLLARASALPRFPEADRVPSNRVMGCTAQVWVTASLDDLGRMRFAADSDSEITKGFCFCVISVLDGALPEEVLDVKPEDFGDLNVVGLPGRANSRVNTWHNVLISMQKRTKALIAEGEGRTPAEPFPSLVIGVDGIQAKGSYAEAQAMFLSPNELKIKELVNVLREKKIGVVAHFYMDPEVQGILTAARKQWPHIHISDSLVMADTAVKMAEAGCQYITVLGVDFMSENVRAILDQAGFEKVGVYRMSNEQIGCSLADAAASPTYMDFLEAASKSPPSLHVIYINTSLETKAQGHELVPTITCTSSNVVPTILQAFVQIPDLDVWYGPDSYMGANIAELFRQMASMSDEEIAEIHPEHNRNSIKSLLPRLHYYQDGNCIVHDMFGHDVVERIKELYCDAFLTAHFEVPGEMFSLAMEAKRRGMGVVGSTQNILDFIKIRVQEALDRNRDDHLQFVLGTESGMVTSIVAAVRGLLGSSESSSGRAKVKVEIVFPVSSDSVSKTSVNGSHGLDSITANDLAKLVVVPGVATGEGCSIHGGCASCPYMKMNSLRSLLRICHQLPDKDGTLWAYEASRFNATTPLGKSVAEVGCEPILHMRHFQATKRLPEKLVHQVLKQSSDGAAVS
ncbi:quinolinate synthase, chloroplastic [Phoenix dactylifera]|uniref:Quinolinate synthase, chloroplastic n=1 Tax=Phoenix dactylifera TaxID=42345 RepID=A0A8B7C897_PHODC|nr:quinolinate synthase, chloroplastic [Phoenix dactylifera]